MNVDHVPNSKPLRKPKVFHIVLFVYPRANPNHWMILPIQSPFILGIPSIFLLNPPVIAVFHTVFPWVFHGFSHQKTQLFTSALHGARADRPRIDAARCGRPLEQKKMWDLTTEKWGGEHDNEKTNLLSLWLFIETISSSLSLSLLLCMYIYIHSTYILFLYVYHIIYSKRGEFDLATVYLI